MHKRILIADDDASIRAHLKHLLYWEFSPVEFGEAGSSEEVLKMLAQSPWDILILDPGLLGENWLEIVGQLVAGGLSTPILLFTSQPEDEFALPSLKAGAFGYLRKNATHGLVYAIYEIWSGRKYPSSVYLAVDLRI